MPTFPLLHSALSVFSIFSCCYALYNILSFPGRYMATCVIWIGIKKKAHFFIYILICVYMFISISLSSTFSFPIFLSTPTSFPFRSLCHYHYLSHYPLQLVLSPCLASTTLFTFPFTLLSPYSSLLLPFSFHYPFVPLPLFFITIGKVFQIHGSLF